MLLRNAWYIGAWADELGDKPLEGAQDLRLITAEMTRGCQCSRVPRKSETVRRLRRPIPQREPLPEDRDSLGKVR